MNRTDGDSVTHSGNSNGTTEMPRIGLPAISHPEVRLNIVRSRFSMSRVARLIQQREADKRKEYAERTKVDVKDILNDQGVNRIRATDSD